MCSVQICMSKYYVSTILKLMYFFTFWLIVHIIETNKLYRYAMYMYTHFRLYSPLAPCAENILTDYTEYKYSAFREQRGRNRDRECSPPPVKDVLHCTDLGQHGGAVLRKGKPKGTLVQWVIIWSFCTDFLHFIFFFSGLQALSHQILLDTLTN